MKSRYIVLLGLALFWSLVSCVSEDKLAMQDESEQVMASAAEPVVEKEDTAPVESASSTPVEPTSIEPVWPTPTAPVESASSTPVEPTSIEPVWPTPTAPVGTASSSPVETASTAPAAVSRAALPGQYVIRSGDTFRAIAARPGIYWNETLWRNIYNANRDKITNPDLILPGTMLLIPPLRDEIREGMWAANQYYENPFAAGVSGANPAASAASANTRQTPVTAQTPARTSTNNALVRRNIVSCKIAGVERADQISYVTLDWAGLGSANGVGMDVKIEAYTANRILVGTIKLENSDSYGHWNRYFSVSGEFLTAYSSWNDRIDFAAIENQSIQIEHQSIGNVFLRIELDGSPFRN